MYLLTYDVPQSFELTNYTCQNHIKQHTGKAFYWF